MGKPRVRYRQRVAWVLAGILIVVLAFEGRHLAHLLPQAEHWIETLGPWGPVIFIAAIFVLEPLLFPNTLFGMIAGVVFGLFEGFLLYFWGMYLANLVVYFIGRHVLHAPVLRALDRQARIRDAVQAAETEGTNLVFWIRILPVSPAFCSYAFGAIQVPFRSVVIGTLGILPTAFFDVYLGTVAAHVTKMAGEGHSNWEIKGVGLLLGLGAFAALFWKVTRIARAQIQAAGVVDAP